MSGGRRLPGMKLRRRTLVATGSGPGRDDDLRGLLDDGLSRLFGQLLRLGAQVSGAPDRRWMRGSVGLPLNVALKANDPGFELLDSFSCGLVFVRQHVQRALQFAHRCDCRNAKQKEEEDFAHHPDRVLIMAFPILAPCFAARIDQAQAAAP
jgi:hypothetical protein